MATEASPVEDYRRDAQGPTHVYFVILAWDLTDSPLTFAELRSWVANKTAADFSKIPGVRVKTWFSNEQKRTWGAVYVVDSPEVIHLDRLPRLPDGRTGPIGGPPTSFSWFALDACVMGPGDLTELRSAGLSMVAGSTS